MLVIYTPKVTNRIKYACDFVFQEYFGIAYSLVETLPKDDALPFFFINYSNEQLEAPFSIFQHSLLIEDIIQTIQIDVSRESDFSVFFTASEKIHTINFDIFSAIFYLVTRYEEYLSDDLDIHGRYKSTNSILAHPAFSFAPIVEVWLDYLKNALLRVFPTLQFNAHQTTCLFTFDVDHPFLYKGRNWRKHLPNFTKWNAWKTLLIAYKDELDIFDELSTLLQQHNVPSIFFFLLNDDGQNNSNVSPLSNAYSALINRIATQHTIGIHPSYNVHFEQDLYQEKSLLERYTNQRIYHARQHFLRLQFPMTYRTLIANAILQDYTLCYPDVPGFRAGFSRAFYFFDLEKNQSTSLLIQPSCWMDATFEYYQTKTTDEIKFEFSKVYNQVKKINGNFVPIFHNDLLVQPAHRAIFDYILQQLKSK